MDLSEAKYPWKAGLHNRILGRGAGWKEPPAEGKSPLGCRKWVQTPPVLSSPEKWGAGPRLCRTPIVEPWAQ